MAKNPSEQTAPNENWGPSVLVLDDEWATLERLKNYLSNEFRVKTAGRAEDALHAMSRESFDVVLTDMRMPDRDGLSLVTEMKEKFPDSQYILMTAFGDIEDTISALRLGVADYLRKPFTEGEVRHALHRCLEHSRLERELADLRQARHHQMSDIVTRDEGMIEICRLAQTVAKTDVTVLISGETGTGKGLLARAMHNISPRAERTFVEIDCASIPATLIESELFGHERGSFTGAVARKLGKVEIAGGGTLVLDEIGEMPLDMQVKLLRFIQNLHFERVGGTKKISADVRIIACTNRNLETEVKEGRFRQDLFYRINVIHLELPPLRERPDDILPLATHFMKRFASKYNRQITGISAAAQKQLLEHNWQGNIRELEHALERAVILNRSANINSFGLDGRALEPVNGGGVTVVRDAGQLDVGGQELGDFLAKCEKHYLTRMLSRNQGRIGDTARAAGINPKTLYLKMNRHNLYRQDFRPPKNQEPEPRS